MLPPLGTKTLVLNDNYMPLAAVPWKKSLKRLMADSICDRCNGRGKTRHGKCPDCGGLRRLPRAVLVSSYEQYPIKTGKVGVVYYPPAVIASQHHVNRAYNKAPYSRDNVFKRDNYTCQYCGTQKKDLKEGNPLEIEHVVPRSRWNGNGTATCWANIVTSCLKCNRSKADFFLARDEDEASQSELHVHMPLFKVINGQKVEYKRPKQPSTLEIGLGFSPYDPKLPEQWKPYVLSMLSEKERKYLQGSPVKA